MSQVGIDELRRVEVFAGLPVEQLEWLGAHGEVVTFAAGDAVFRAGEPADTMVVILEGAIELLVGVGGQLVPTFVQYAGEVTGLLPFSRLQHYTGAGRAAGPLRVLQIHRRHFAEMLREVPALGQRLVSVMADRVRDATRAQERRDKLSALGTLAAGLAHELNNPAAAIRRDAEALDARLSGVMTLAARLCATGLNEPELLRLGELAASITARPAPPLDPRSRSRREDAVGEWLDAHGLAEPWALSGTLVDAGVTEADLDELDARLPGAATPAAVAWLETLLDATRLSRNIRAASARISDLVHSVKTYSHMDRALDKAPTDLRQGLDSTLVLLGHKLKAKNLRVERVYADDLPQVDAYAGELNQVWTNLLDNAIDAAPVDGCIRVEAARDGTASVAVRIIDNGPGIPPEMQQRIFEPFFTTKPVGQGTGLGLDIVERIVVQQHGGSIEVDSVPGRTVLLVRLPIAR